MTKHNNWRNQCGLRGNGLHRLIVAQENDLGVIIRSFNNGGSEGRGSPSGGVMTGCCRKINLPCIKEFPDGHWDSQAA